MSMQQRLFPSLGTIASYSLETLKPDMRESGYTNSRGRCTPKRGKLVPLTNNLRFPTGDCMVFPSQAQNWSLFGAKTLPENGGGMLGTEVGALFRVSNHCTEGE
jgi:hypothetical protein